MSEFLRITKKSSEPLRGFPQTLLDHLASSRLFGLGGTRVA